MKELKIQIKNMGNYMLLTISLFLIHLVFQPIVVNIFKKISFFNLNDKIIYNLVLIITCLLEMILFTFIFKKDINKSLNIKKDIKYHLKLWIIGLTLMIVFNLIINNFIFKGSIANNEEINRKILKTNPTYFIFSVIFYGPFIEELIFRASLKKGFKNIILYSIISGLLFGGIHVFETLLTATSLSSFIHELLYILPYGSLGFCFAYAYFKTNNINTSILTHAIHNLFVLLIIVLC